MPMVPEVETIEPPVLICTASSAPTTMLPMVVWTVPAMTMFCVASSVSVPVAD